MFTSITDVTDGYEGTVPDDQLGWLSEQITEAELVLEVRLGDLAVWADTDLRRRALRAVVRRVVRRVLRNPAGYRSESDGDVSYTLDPRVASGAVWVTDEDWALLGVGGRRVGTILLGSPVRA